MSELDMTEVTPKPSRFATLRYYATLGYGAAGSMVALGLLVTGTYLVGLAVPVVLAGIGLTDITHDMTTGPLIISGLILGLAGGFCIGVASESPLGRGKRLQGFKIWEVGIGRTLAVFVVGFGFLFAYRTLVAMVGDIPVPLLKGLETLRAVGGAGMVAMPLIGVPVSLLLRAAPTRHTWVRSLDEPALFAVWVIATLFPLA